jgi:hypothetical protein
MALLLCNGCGLSSGMPEGSQFIPADSALALSFNLPALTATDLYKELQQQGGAVGLNRLNFMQFAKAAGLDPVRDVKWLTFLGRGAAEEGLQVDQLSALVSGSFDGGKVYSFMKESGLPFETHAGLDIFQVLIVDDRCRLCIAILDDHTAAFGDGETLRGMGEARQNPSSALASDETAARLLTRLDSRAAIWGIARGRRLAGSLAGFLQQMAAQSKEAAAFTSIEDIAFFVAAGENILLAADAVARSEEDAMLIADILEGAGAMGRLALKQARQQEAGKFLTSFKVQVDGLVVRASTSFPQSALVELAQGAMSDLFLMPAMPFGLGGMPGMGGATPDPADDDPPATEDGDGGSDE